MAGHKGVHARLRRAMPGHDFDATGTRKRGKSRGGCRRRAASSPSPLVGEGRGGVGRLRHNGAPFADPHPRPLPTRGRGEKRCAAICPIRHRPEDRRSRSGGGGLNTVRPS